MLIKLTRPYKAGNQVAKALAEIANCLYLLDNRLQYLSGIKNIIDIEIDIVKQDIVNKENKKHKGIYEES